MRIRNATNHKIFFFCPEKKYIKAISWIYIYIYFVCGLRYISVENRPRILFAAWSSWRMWRSLRGVRSIPPPESAHRFFFHFSFFFLAILAMLWFGVFIALLKTKWVRVVFLCRSMFWNGSFLVFLHSHTLRSSLDHAHYKIKTSPAPTTKIGQ